MKRLSEFIYSLHPLLLSSIASTLTVAQIVLAFFYNQPGLEVVKRATRSAPGWVGLVVDAHEGTPLPNATVRLRQPSFRGPAQPSALVTVTDTAGRFSLLTEGRAPAEGSLIEIHAPHHAVLTRPLPPPGELRVALVARRRALLDRLVAWARHRGPPWWTRAEPTPAQIAKNARARGATPTALWADAIEKAAFGPDPPDETQEVELAEPNWPVPQGAVPRDSAQNHEETRRSAKQR